MATKAAYHHGNLKAALITAALRELAHEGPEGISLRGVARRAGVSAPAVYRHFEDKEDLLGAVAAECADRLADAMVAAVAAAPADPLEKFRAVGVALVRFAVAHPEHFRALSMPGLADKTPPEQRAKQQAWERAQMQGLAAAQAAGMIAAFPLDALMLAANSTIMGLAHAIIEGRLGEVDDARATELAIAVTGVLGHGLMPRETPVTDPRKPDCEPTPPRPRPRKR
ncbi:MAG: Transcriptional regulator, TetR family protein [Myxococcales bacterium]|nr:Transcriptional regulator, TetR family protein [Myxococcales bacterium]